MTYYLRTNEGIDTSKNFISIDQAVDASVGNGAVMGISQCNDNGQPIKHYDLKTLVKKTAKKSSKKPNTEEEK